MDGDTILRISIAAADDAIRAYGDPFRLEDGFSASAFRDDLVSVGCVGICEGVGDYDPDAGAKLTSFAYLIAFRDCLDLLRSEYRRHCRSFSLRLHDRACDDVSEFDVSDLSVVLDDVEFSLLDGYLSGESLSDVGCRLGLGDRRKLYRVFSAIRAKLRHYLNEGTVSC